MTHSELAEKYGASKSTIAWHLRRNGNGKGETSHDAAPEVAQHREDAPLLEARERSATANGHAVERTVSPANRHPSLDDASGLVQLQGLVPLLDAHWQSLGIRDKVALLLRHYASA